MKVNYIEALRGINRSSLHGFAVIVDTVKNVEGCLEREEYDRAKTLLVKMVRQIKVHVQEVKSQMYQKEHGVVDFSKWTEEIMDQTRIKEKLATAFEIAYAKGYNAGADMARQEIKEKEPDEA